MLVYVSIDIQQIPEWDLTTSNSLRVLGKFSLKTSSSYTYKREKEREIEWERKDKLKLVMYVDIRMI